MNRKHSLIAFIVVLALGASGTLVTTAYVSHFSDPNTNNNHATDSNIVLHLKLYLPLVMK